MGYKVRDVETVSELIDSMVEVDEFPSYFPLLDERHPNIPALRCVGGSVKVTGVSRSRGMG